MGHSAAVISTPTKRKLPKAEIARLTVGILIILGILYGQYIFGLLTRESRIDPAIPRSGMVNIVAVLNFDPERFHNERLAAYGMLSGRDGSVRRVRLRQVTQDDLIALASQSWIGRLEPMR